MDSVAVDAVLSFYPDRFRSRGWSLPPAGPGFSGAIVLRIETEAGPFCLRGWPPQADPERIRGLHRLLAHCRTCGVDFVAAPVAANDGRKLVFIQDRWWQLEPWMPGRADFSAQPSNARLTAAVTALSRLHVAMATFEPVGPEKQWFGSSKSAIAPAVVERFERLQSWTPKKLATLRAKIESTPETIAGFNSIAQQIAHGFERCAARVETGLRRALHLRVPVQPCLRDVWHDHILFAGDNVSGIIDPAAARSDTVAADFSRLLGSLIVDSLRECDLSQFALQSSWALTMHLKHLDYLETPLPKDTRDWYSALAAYQSVRRLSPEELSLVPLLDQSGTLLSGMTWLDRRFFSNIEFEEPQRVVARIKQIAKRIGVFTRTS